MTSIFINGWVMAMVKVLPAYLLFLMAFAGHVYASEAYPNTELLEFLADWASSEAEERSMGELLAEQELKNDKEAAADNE